MNQHQTTKEATDPATSHKTHNWIIVSVIWFIVGLIVFLTYAWFDDSPAWDKVYYLWDKAKDTILFIALSAAYRPLRRMLQFIIIFALIRLCWEILTIVITISPNQQTGVNILWLILVGITVILSLKQLLNEWKNSC